MFDPIIDKYGLLYFYKLELDENYLFNDILFYLMKDCILTRTYG